MKKGILIEWHLLRQFGIVRVSTKESLYYLPLTSIQNDIPYPPLAGSIVEFEPCAVKVQNKKCTLLPSAYKATIHPPAPSEFAKSFMNAVEDATRDDAVTPKPENGKGGVQ